VRQRPTSLYPPDDDKTHPPARLPTTTMHRPITGPPTACSGQSSHDYINLPALTQRRYVNVEPMLQDPAVQKARERHVAAAEAAAAASEPKESTYENIQM